MTEASGNRVSCIFCDIVIGKSPSSDVYCSDRTIAFLDIQPVNSGHLIVVPVAHAANLAGLSEEDGRDVFAIAQQLAAALYRSDLRCEGVNLFLADGEAAGQEVFHVHLHVIPRYRRDGFGLRLPKRYYKKPPRRKLDAVAESIRRALGTGPAALNS